MTFTILSLQVLGIILPDGISIYWGRMHLFNHCPCLHRKQISCSLEQEREQSVQVISCACLNPSSSLKIKIHYKSICVRQAKPVISCKVKVLAWNSREWVQRPNQPPVSSVAPLAEYCVWLQLHSMRTKIGEAYTENCIGHRGLARPWSYFSIVSL